MEQKIIFLDIDGTLTKPGTLEPPASAQEAIRRARENGHKVLLCTGRNRKMLTPMMRFGFDGFIGSAGGFIQYGDDVIYDCPLTEEQRMRALAAFAKSNVAYTLECKDASFAHDGFQEVIRARAKLRYKTNSEFERWEKNLSANDFFRPLADYNGEPIYKIVFVAPSRADIKSLEDALSGDFQFCDQSGNDLIVNGELINRKFNKGTAMLKICEYLGISREHTIAFGDSMNDYEMIQTAALGICMDNGSDALKAAADEICPALEEDGLYKVFEKHGLI